ncbi:MAG: hypothetical protein US63_C0008G0020 [Candidatus Moranbacteria bacterium GW2011_GWC2_37_8]|nr:MAG: hypothetical protein US63_C0008G0020 [Candidatus Moranbacteria bacterium GW2011_GWC2_37_8]KKQ62401.1 MAG: hypothetical protein US82_C0012G0019 [Parcubacteria group bacterium GW2011_GWC1_38_22]
MIKFNEKYSKTEFLSFLEDFLPEDFVQKDEDIVIRNDRYKEIKKANVIGFSESLDLYVLEMEHGRENDPRITIATDAFKILADYWVHNALVIFKNKDTENYRFSLLTITLDQNEKNNVIKKYSNARRYSFYLGKDAKIKTPKQQLETKGRIKSKEDLLERFSVEVVNKQFYLEVAKYFDDLVSRSEKKMILPSVSDENSNVYKNFAVRLIGRIMFCWFLKQKKTIKGQLIPDEILSTRAVIDNSNYYHNILEPLFFEVLNTDIENRGIKSNFFDQVPYLNGGLFSPQLDDYYKLDRITFSSVYINTLIIKDEWFKDFYELLETYNFTIDENTVFDQELSVDPEMLGRIFENLLAEINPVTGDNDRKRTGSFYTPRQIVEYMVDQSLLEYFKVKTKSDENKLKSLISYDLNDDLEYPLNDVDKLDIVRAIDALKILDPACGSGAFPMGILQKIVYILQIVDPTCELWINEKLKDIPGLWRQKLRESYISQPLDYTRKLDVIKNSIFGVDIQSIAVEVSRLRCFLTLVVESEIQDEKKNRGIETLPNLDFKFVCANSLISAPDESVKKGDVLFEDDFQMKLADAVDKYFNSNGENKRAANNEIHKLIDEKVNEKLKHLDNLVAYGGNAKLETVRALMNKKTIEENSNIMSLWSSYKNIFEHKAVGFFDPKYFFPSIKDGFDIVIGNPPYVQLQKFARTQVQKDLENQKFETFAKNGDLYCLFYERGMQLLKNGGVMALITSNKWMRASYGEKLRRYLANKNPLRLLDFGGFKVFDSATVDTNILLIKNEINKNFLQACHFKNDYRRGESLQVYCEGKFINLNNLSLTAWLIGDLAELAIRNKVEKIGKPLKEWNVKINFGIKTSLNEAFIINSDKRNELILLDSKSSEIIKPILRGRDIRRYSNDFAELYLLQTGYDIDVPNLYPAVYKHLLKFEEKAKKRNDQGKNWWNLRSCVYYEDFEKDKVVWPDIMREPKGTSEKNREFPYFCLDREGFYQEATNFMMTGDNLTLIIAVLNSKAGVYFFTNWFAGPRFDNKGFRYKKAYLENFLMPLITPANQDIVKKIEIKVDQISKLKKDNKKEDTKVLEKDIDHLVYQFYELDNEEIEIIESNNK